MSSIREQSIIVGLFVLLATTCTTVSINEKQIVSTFRQMAGNATRIRVGTQFAALYLPPLNNLENLVFVGEFPSDDMDSNHALYPVYPGHYPYNFAASRPDHLGEEFNTRLNRAGHRTIHTEDILLNVAYSPMAYAFQGREGRPPNIIYLYTYYLPCRSCRRIIQDFQQSNPGASVYVAFTTPQGNMTGPRLRNIMNDFNRHIRGRIFHIPEPNTGNCLASGFVQRGPSVPDHDELRRKRNVLNDGRQCTDDHILVIKMDFTTGNAQVMWFIPTEMQESCSWIGLYDREGNRRTWECVNGWFFGCYSVSHMTESMTTTFNTGISEGFQVRLHCNSNVRRSFKWDKCGFQKRKLKNLPTSYGDVWMWLTVNGGKPEVNLEFSQGKKVAWGGDWVTLQNENDAFSSYYHGSNWQYVSYIQENGARYTYTYVFNGGYSGLENGFRVKYIYDAWYWPMGNYKWAGVYDNATPFWTPDGCIGTAT